MAGGQVDQGRGNEEGAHAPRPLLVQLQRRLFDGAEAADSRADDDARALARSLVLGRPASVAHRLVGGGDRVQNEVVDPAAVLGGHHLVRVEGTLDVRPAAPASIDARDLAGHLAGVVARIEGRDAARARTALEDTLP